MTTRKLWAAVAAGLMVLGVGCSARDLNVDVSSPRGGSPTVRPGEEPATFRAEARGVTSSTGIDGLTQMTFESLDLRVTARLLGGRQDGQIGSIRIQGDGIVLEGRDIGVPGEVTIRPDGVTIGTNLAFGGRTTVRGGQAIFQGEGEEVTLSGPVSFEPADSEARGMLRRETGRWLDPPRTMRLGAEASSRLSWAGNGTVVTPTGTDLGHEFVLLRGLRTEATVERQEGRVVVEGETYLRQVYLDGVPQLETQGTVDLVSTRATVAVGDSGRLTWAPRNLGAFDMAMTRIRPATEPARWLSLGLGGLPANYGGERRPVQGGDTTGFRSGRAIRSVLTPGSADRRHITFRPPSGTPSGTYEAMVVIEGNFPDIGVQFEITVVDEGEVVPPTQDTPMDPDEFPPPDPDPGMGRAADEMAAEGGGNDDFGVMATFGVLLVFAAVAVTILFTRRGRTS